MIDLALRGGRRQELGAGAGKRGSDQAGAAVAYINLNPFLADDDVVVHGDAERPCHRDDRLRRLDGGRF